MPPSCWHPATPSARWPTEPGYRDLSCPTWPNIKVLSYLLIVAADRRSCPHLKESTGPEVSPQTVRRTLRRMGFKAVVKKRKPALKTAHRRARLAFTKRYQEFTLDDWKRIVWSDETKINRFGSDGRRWTWRVPRTASETIPDREVQPTYKYGGGGIMLWG